MFFFISRFVDRACLTTSSVIFQCKSRLSRKVKKKEKKIPYKNCAVRRSTLAEGRLPWEKAASSLFSSRCHRL